MYHIIKAIYEFIEAQKRAAKLEAAEQENFLIEMTTLLKQLRKEIEKRRVEELIETTKRQEI